MTLQARQKTTKLFKWLGIALVVAVICLVLSLIWNNPPPLIGIAFGGILVSSLVFSFFFYLMACEALAKAKGYNPVIIATLLLGGAAAFLPFLVIGVFTPLILLLVLPDTSSPSKSSGQ